MDNADLAIQIIQPIFDYLMENEGSVTANEVAEDYGMHTKAYFDEVNFSELIQQKGIDLQLILNHLIDYIPDQKLKEIFVDEFWVAVNG